MPVYSAPTCPLDQILLDFFQKRRRFPLDGTNVETAVGLEKLSVKALINKDEVDKVDPLSGIMSRVLTTFAHVGLTEKLAFFYLMTHTMRVSSSASSRDAPIQLFIVLKLMLLPSG